MSASAKRGARSRLRFAAVVLGAWLPAACTRDADRADGRPVPGSARGHDVYTMDVDITGKRSQYDRNMATFYFTDQGFLPMSTKRVEILSAGPDYTIPRDDSPVSYRWRFRVKFAPDARPVAMTVENVTDRARADTLLPKTPVQRGVKIAQGADKAIYGVPVPEWEASGPKACLLVAHDPCSHWLFDTEGSPLAWDPGAVFVALRFTFEYQGGTTETVYQGLSFHPDRELARIAEIRKGPQD